jgi:type IV secretion system protein VirD4
MPFSGGYVVKQSNDHSGGSLTAKLLITSAFGTALVKTYPVVMTAPYGPEWGIYVWSIGAVLTASGIAAIARDVVQIATGVSRNLRALRPAKTGASAQWLSARQACKAGLGKTAGMFLGIVDGQPLFIPNAVHSLVCAPARKGKTTASVMPALLHDIGTSRMVADMKGELAVQTASVIERVHGHTVLILNPGQKFDLPNAGYNPMQIILDDLEHTPLDAIADARSLSFQLHPEPAGGSREPFWGNGTRKLLTLAIIGLCVLRPTEEANLSSLFLLISDSAALNLFVCDALNNDALGGELTALAKSNLSTWTENPKHFESFCEAAIQSLVPFGPSGRLATSVQHCDFRFRDLKAAPTTVFVICDPSRADVFAPWIGLIVWAALKELIREDNTIPVRLILDEFTNYHLPGLPSMLTALAGYGILCTMVVQELEEIARVYGREALITIMSQSDVK